MSDKPDSGRRKTFLDTLGLPPDAGPEEIRRAYRTLKESHSAESSGNPHGQNENRPFVMGEIEAAYRALTEKTDGASADVSEAKGKNGDAKETAPAGTKEKNGEAKVAAPAGTKEKNGDAKVAAPAGTKEKNGDAKVATPIGTEEKNGDAKEAAPAETDEKHMVFTGRTLREIREKQNVEFDDITRETKISQRMLNAIENENFDALPPEVYVRGFVKGYAAYLCLNVNKVVTDYMSRYGAWKNSADKNRMHFRFSRKKGAFSIQAKK